MTSSYLIIATLAMAAVTFVTRAVPALIPQRLLDKPWLHRLNESLPLSVLALLIFTSLAYQNVSFATGLNTPQWRLLFAQLGALSSVLLIYHYSKQLLVSMIVGIAALNGLLWLFEQLLP